MQSYSLFYAEVQQACRRIVGHSGERVSVSVKPSEYVLPGQTLTITTKQGAHFPFWLGVNVSRLFFIAYVDVIPEKAKSAFQFCFGGAEKIGWDVNYEKIEHGTSIWATCMTDRDRPLVNKELTDDGLFWATDIAMMVQSWVRTCERNLINRHQWDPAPL